MEYLHTINRIKQRLKLPLPGSAAHERMLSRLKPSPFDIPEHARSSAVLSLLFPEKDDLKLLLIKRTEDGHAHSGQISFPGGRQDPTDVDLRATALREAQEEVGIPSSDVEILGQLTELYIPVSNFLVYPFLAFSERRPQYNLCKAEVDRVLEVPLKEVLSERRKTIARVTSPVDETFVRRVNAYRLDDGSIVWGATAMILSELELIVRELHR